jgi:hypothetical protein
MDIHSRKWKTLINKTRICADMLIDEIRGNLELKKVLLHSAVRAEVYPWPAKSRVFSRTSLKSACGKVSSSLSESISS